MNKQHLKYLDSVIKYADRESLSTIKVPSIILAIYLRIIPDSIAIQTLGVTLSEMGLNTTSWATENVPIQLLKEASRYLKTVLNDQVVKEVDIPLPKASTLLSEQSPELITCNNFDDVISDKNLLPSRSGIYIVTKEELDITGAWTSQTLYVGLSGNIRDRWKNHHRVKQLQSLKANKILTLEVGEYLLKYFEAWFIWVLNPELNYQGVPNRFRLYKPSKTRERVLMVLEHDPDCDGVEMEFNDDGECIRGSVWDYPGSPYLSEEDDIY